MVTGSRGVWSREYEGEVNGEGVVHAAWAMVGRGEILCRPVDDYSLFFTVAETSMVTCLQCLAKL